MVPIPEKPKEGSSKKKKFWNKRKGQSSQEPSKKQQTVAAHTVIVPAAVPTPVPTTVSVTPATPNRKGHTACVCRAPTQPISQVPSMGVSQACYECGEVGHYKGNFHKLKNASGTGRVLAISYEEAVADPNVVTGAFLLNDSYACILFDISAEKSFIIHKFKHLLQRNPKALKYTFTIEMANGKIEKTNDIYIGCKLTLNNHSFQIDLMPVSIKSSDIIIGIDWLSFHRADILCYEKVSHPQT
ncbi:uncharacterized protein LOC111894877 [Lactuca sativa]|uniref:uncharacterized protein LOC111894877 n=1 Tax=Lactuca sativa TaxID=4236 RepID=UPI000CD8F5B9|nr:uncharacterized protein LOC111894877 [Lactuca sativa]